MSDVLLKISNLSKAFESQGQKLEIIKSLDLNIEKGKSIALSGPSGSGKSTLAQLIAGTLSADAGSMLWHQAQDQIVDLQKFGEEQRCAWRLKQVGFVFQDFRLFPHLTALENATLSLNLLGFNKAESTKEVLPYFQSFSIDHRMHHFPYQLSGGEQQRIAIIRAIAHQPLLLIADEPTGNLDRDTAISVSDLLLSIPKQLNSALLIVTHDLSLAQSCDQHYQVQKGKLIAVHES